MSSMLKLLVPYLFNNPTTLLSGRQLSGHTQIVFRRKLNAKCEQRVVKSDDRSRVSSLYKKPKATKRTCEPSKHDASRILSNQKDHIWGKSV